MKKFLLLFTLLIGSLCSVSAAEQVAFQCLFGTSYNSKGVSAYETSWTSTVNGKKFNIVNCNNNNNDWEYIRAGSKNAAYVASIATAFASQEAITKIEITIDAITANSVKNLYVISSTSSDFSDKVEEVTVTKSTGTQTVEFTEPQAGLYYKFVMDCAKSSNGIIQISELAYYYNPVPAAPTFDIEDESEVDAGTVLHLSAEGGASIYYRLGLDEIEEGTAFELYNDAEAIELVKPNDIYVVEAYAEKDGVQSETVTAMYMTGKADRKLAWLQQVGDENQVVTKCYYNLNEDTLDKLPFPNFDSQFDGQEVAKFEFTSEDTDVAAIVDGSSIEIKGLGTTIITLTIKGTDNYKEATASFELVVVGRIVNVPTFDPESGSEVTINSGINILTDEGDAEIYCCYGESDIAEDAKFELYQEGDVVFATAGTYVVKAYVKVGNDVSKTVTATYTVVKQDRELVWVNANGEPVTEAHYVIDGWEDEMELPGLPDFVSEDYKVTSSVTSVATVGEWGEITVVGAGETTITINVPEDATYKAATASYTLIATAPYAGRWELADNIKDGDKIIIVGKQSSTNQYYALSDQSGNGKNRTAVEVSVNNNLLVINDQQVAEINVSAAGDSYELYVTNYTPGYLYAASSKENLLKTQENSDDNTKATISINKDTNLATIKYNSSNTHNKLLYNINNKLFACYEKGSNAIVEVYIYKYVQPSFYTATAELVYDKVESTYSRVNTLTLQGIKLVYKGREVTEDLENYFVWYGEQMLGTIVGGEHLEYLPTTGEEFTIRDAERNVLCTIDDLEWMHKAEGNISVSHVEYYLDEEDPTQINANYYFEANHDLEWELYDFIERKLVGWSAEGAKLSVAGVGTYFSNGTSAPFNKDLIKVGFTFPFAVHTRHKTMMAVGQNEDLNIHYAITDSPVTFNPSTVSSEHPIPNDISGVMNVTVDGIDGAEYYNLQGVKIEGDLAPGIYIRRQGTTTTKVTIK